MTYENIKYGSMMIFVAFLAMAGESLVDIIFNWIN